MELSLSWKVDSSSDNQEIAFPLLHSITMFEETHFWTLSWATWVKSTSLHHISLRIINIFYKYDASGFVITFVPTKARKIIADYINIEWLVLMCICFPWDWESCDGNTLDIVWEVPGYWLFWLRFYVVILNLSRSMPAWNFEIWPLPNSYILTINDDIPISFISAADWLTDAMRS